MRPRVGLFRGLAAFLALAALAACAPEDNSTSDAGGPSKEASGSASPSASTAAACAKESLRTRTPGKLTIATDQPAYEPWFVDDDPTNGKGFESAVAYAVAEELGFARSDVTWARVRFNAAIQPGPKDFDFDVNEFTITEQRKKAVDFSTPYYDATQAVIALKSSKIAKAGSVAALKNARLGAQVNTTSYNVITDVVKPTVEPRVYPNNDNAKQSLQNGAIDGLVVDLPTAFYMTSAEIENSVIVGQIEQQAGTPEQFGLVLDKGSPLTTCVSAAVDALREDGTLKQLADQWLADVAGAPVLR
ncbi:ABC transporter substrate-binding protein [Actinopolymorpha alba]|uniref:ABC transporter substrate-binding protein n=1 Tax=Actinopolymorpha alba TaxID=533267 RepID=UPI00037483DB|nr:ABC transporter substrate-binding protein [Actinopolymorpha alba]